jgi:hypothetical protein
MPGVSPPVPLVGLYVYNKRVFLVEQGKIKVCICGQLWIAKE